MEDKENCPCCGRTRERTESERKALDNRLNRIEGQIGGIRRMLDRSEYCADLIVQAAAVRGSVDSLIRELISQHLRKCVAEDIRGGSDSAVEDLISLLGMVVR